MSVVISIRVPRRLKEEMDKLSDEVSWSEEIRRFIETRIREIKKRRALEKIDRIVESLPASPGASFEVRRDRDNR